MIVHLIATISVYGVRFSGLKGDITPYTNPYTLSIAPLFFNIMNNMT